MVLQVKFSWSAVLGWSASGLVLGASAAALLVGLGLAFPISPVSLLLILPLIGIAAFIVTLPIRKYRKSSEKEGVERLSRPNPFQSFRLLVLSRAILLTGAGFLGWHVGVLIWVFSFSAAADSVVNPTLFGVIGSFVMSLGGYLAQNNCKTPKDPEGEAS